MQPFDWYANEDLVDAWFVDSGGNDIEDLSHLESETVTLWADGEPDTTYTVSGGEISPASSFTNYTVGLPYTSTFESMPLITYSDEGLSASHKTQVSNVVLDVYETLDFNVGSSSTKKSEQNISSLQTGLWPTEHPRGFYREATMYFDVNEPSPFTLRGISAQLEISYSE